MRGAMSNIAAARKQLYSQKVRRQEDAGLALSQQLRWSFNECNYYLLLQNTFSDREGLAFPAGRIPVRAV